MKAPAKAMIVLFLFAFGVGAFWYVGENVRDEVFAAADQNPLLQIEDYQKGLLSSKFKLITYGGQLRLLGKIDHGPFLWSDRKLGLASIYLTVDPFQMVTSPWKTVIDKFPLLKASHVDVLVNLNRTYTISGEIPEMEVTFPSKQGDLIVDFSGMVFDGSGTDKTYSVSGRAKRASLKGPEQMDMIWGDMLFSAQGTDMLSLIPTDWKSDFTLGDFSMSWVENGSPKTVVIDEIVATSRGATEEGLVSAGALYQVKSLSVDGQSFGNLDYSINLKGLTEDGLIKMANWFSQFYSLTGLDEAAAAETFRTLAPEFLPILYRVLDDNPDLEIRVKSSQPSFGENEGIVQLRLLDEKHLPLVSRILGGVSLNLDERAAVLLARFGMAGSQNLQGLPIDSQEIVVKNFIKSITEEGLIGRIDDRYTFNASYSGKEGLVRYGKAGVFPFQLEQIFQAIQPFMIPSD